MTTILKHILNFFFSLRTTLWLSAFILALFLAGAIIMPAHEEFQMLHSVSVFEFIRTQNLQLTWWLWGLMGLLSLLTVNTLFCSIESIIKKRKVTQWVLLISPQIIHIGFLFILLAHFLSAAGSSQRLTVAHEGNILRISDDTVLSVKDINIQADSEGYISDWQVRVEYLSDGKPIQRDTISPNSPSLLTGFNINVKNLQASPYKAVLLQISREPGAVWALAGSILFMVGIFSLIALKIKMEK